MPREAILYACITTNTTRAVRQKATSVQCKAANFALLDRDVLTVPAADARHTGPLHYSRRGAGV